MCPLLDVPNLKVIGQKAMVMDPDGNMEDIHVVGVKGESFMLAIPHGQVSLSYNLAVQPRDGEQVDEESQPSATSNVG